MSNSVCNGGGGGGRYSIRAINYNHKLQSRIVSAFVPPECRNFGRGGFEERLLLLSVRRGEERGEETNSSRNELTIIASPFRSIYTFPLSLPSSPLLLLLPSPNYSILYFRTIGTNDNSQNWPPLSLLEKERKGEGKEGRRIFISISAGGIKLVTIVRLQKSPALCILFLVLSRYNSAFFLPPPPS